MIKLVKTWNIATEVHLVKFINILFHLYILSLGKFIAGA